MKKQLNKLRLPFRLSILSNIVMIFLNESNARCGSKGYGLPMEFIHSYCGCPRHSIPIDFIGLLIDLCYHFIIWFSLLYLWEDAKETWSMLFVKNTTS